MLPDLDSMRSYLTGVGFSGRTSRHHGGASAHEADVGTGVLSYAMPLSQSADRSDNRSDNRSERHPCARQVDPHKA